MEQTEKRTKKHGFLRVLLRTLAILLGVILLTALVLTVIPMTETVEPKTAEGSADWMKDLDGGLRLNELVLPGTHDSATQYVQLAFFSKCQALSVGEQLEAGVRYLDIRLGIDGDRMKLMHGFTNCKTGAMPWDGALYLDEVLDECCAFLRAHPTETVIFAVKKEHGDETAETFAAQLEPVIAEHPELWYTGNTIPTLDEARGKLVLFRRYVDRSLPENADCLGIPFNWAEQKGHADTNPHTAVSDKGSYQLWVQDRFEYGADDKWTAFTAGLNAAGTGRSDLAVHFLSTKGTLAYSHPYSFAKTLNARLPELSARELSGWIVLDFVNADLCRHIWSANFAE